MKFAVKTKTCKSMVNAKDKQSQEIVLLTYFIMTDTNID